MESQRRSPVAFRNCQKPCAMSVDPKPLPSSNDVELPACMRLPPRKITVSFAPTVVVNKVLHLNNYTDEEFEATWYDHWDLTRFRTEVKYSVKLIERGDLTEDTETHSLRGLEYHTSFGSQRRESNKAAARDAVFDEQEYQWDREVFEPESIAYAYIMYSRPCHFAAHALGLQDERDAHNDSIRSHGKKTEEAPRRKCPKVKIGRTAQMRRYSNAAA